MSFLYVRLGLNHFFTYKSLLQSSLYGYIIPPMDMKRIYKCISIDKMLWTQCMLLCIMMFAIAFASELPRETYQVSVPVASGSVMSGSHVDAPEVKAESHAEAYQVVRSVGAVSECRTLGSKPELNLVTFAVLLATILLLILFWTTPRIYRSVGSCRVSIISYIHSQDGRK